MVPTDTVPTDSITLAQKILGSNKNNNKVIKSHRNKITINQLFAQHLHHPRHYDHLEMKQKAGRENRLVLSQLTTQTSQWLVARLLPHTKLLESIGNESGIGGRPVMPTYRRLPRDLLQELVPQKPKNKPLNVIRLPS